jgi:PTS system nitrogen regulatory IIA component
MPFDTLFRAQCIAPSLRVSSKKQLFGELSSLAASCPSLLMSGVSERDILSAVMERERLGTTGIGSGVAIPHARIEGLTQMSAVFARLETPIEYESVDERPVDLVVLLLAPKDAGAEHLRALARVSRLLRREDARARFRAAPTGESLFAMLIEGESSNAA